MNFLPTALALKFLSVWLVLLFFGLIGGPSPTQAAVIALVVGALSIIGDRMLPFRVQGVTRWAIDGGLAFLGIYIGQYLWPGQAMSLATAVFAGAVVGAVEIPIHFFLASRFGLRKKNDDHDGIR